MQSNIQNDNWQPLESNPDVMNEYSSQIGLNAEQFSFFDLLGFEDWAYEMIPQPVIGVIFNYPIKPGQDEFAQKEQQSKEGQLISEKLFYMKQVAKNSCGSVAIVHLILNMVDIFPDLIKEGSILAQLAAQIKGKSPMECGQIFKQMSELKEAHKSAVQQGQSEVCDEIDRHFISFVLIDSIIYELDGIKNIPINHGFSQPQTFLSDTAKILKGFFERDPTEVQFATIVLSKNPVD